MYTKGEWKVKPVNTVRQKRAYKIMSSEDILIGSDEALANACIIASAPTLLSACKEAIVWLQYFVDKLPNESWSQEEDDKLDNIYKIIKQAEGK